MQIKVVKNLRLKATLLGLHIPLFNAYLVVAFLSVLYLISTDFNFMKLVKTLGFAALIYLVLLGYQNVDLGNFLKKLPNKIIK